MRNEQVNENHVDDDDDDAERTMCLNEIENDDDDEMNPN
jgi:hypothetical protein